MRVVIDGPIGSGKSTQLRMLQEQGFQVYPERIDLWPLEQFYKDPHNWALVMQCAVLKSYNMGPVNGIYERCAESAKQVFWKNLCDTGIASQSDKEIYDVCHDKMSWIPDLYILLQCQPEKCLEHIQNRKQTGDQSITLEYLRNLDELYKNIKLPTKMIYIQVQGKSREEICREIVSAISKHGQVQSPEVQ